MRAPRGSLGLGTIAGIPLAVHWSAVLGVLLALTWRASLGTLLAYFLIVLVHELGHAWFVRHRQLFVFGIVFTGFGGECLYAGGGDYDRAFIAWGGVFTQTLLVAAALCVDSLIPEARAPVILRDVSWTLIAPNALMIVLNLLPLRPFDGAQAWRIGVVRATRPARPIAGLARTQRARRRRG